MRSRLRHRIGSSIHWLHGVSCSRIVAFCLSPLKWSSSTAWSEPVLWLRGKSDEKTFRGDLIWQRCRSPCRASPTGRKHLSSLHMLCNARDQFFNEDQSRGHVQNRRWHVWEVLLGSSPGFKLTSVRCGNRGTQYTIKSAVLLCYIHSIYRCLKRPIPSLSWIQIQLNTASS